MSNQELCRVSNHSSILIHSGTGVLPALVGLVLSQLTFHITELILGQKSIDIQYCYGNHKHKIFIILKVQNGNQNITPSEATGENTNLCCVFDSYFDATLMTLMQSAQNNPFLFRLLNK